MDLSTQEKIGKSLGRIVSGIGILTTQSGSESGAMLSSWFQQCSFDPPMISVALKKGRWIGEMIQSSKKFALNILHTGEKKMIAHFGKGFEKGVDPFVGITIEKRETGVPVLKESLCFLECELVEVISTGDHQLFLGKVIHAGTEEEGAPMIHIRRNGFNY